MSWLRRLLGRPKTYRLEDFERRERYRADYRALASWLLREVAFESAFDVGCANGFLLEPFAAAGRRVAGIEGSAAVREVLTPELRKLVEIGDFADAVGLWDLVCCVEVAEHIPAGRSAELVETIARLAHRSVYFTAALPGQAGRGHINCRPHEEWLAMFAGHGWVPDATRTAALRKFLRHRPSIPWLAANSFLLLPESG